MAKKHSKIGKASIIVTCILLCYMLIASVIDLFFPLRDGLIFGFKEIRLLNSVEKLGALLGFSAMFEKGTRKEGPIFALAVNLLLMISTWISAGMGIGLIFLLIYSIVSCLKSFG